MKLVSDGIVLKEVKVRESDRIITILTRDRGIISASAKGSLRVKNKLATSTGLLCYSDFTLFSGKTMYTVDDAAVRNVFFELRTSVEGLAVAMYMAELTLLLAPEDAPAGEYLDHLLQAFAVVCEGKHPLKLVKAVFELRLMAMSGYMPSLVGCDNCAEFEDKTFYFDIPSAYILCASCSEKAAKVPNTTFAVISAMRHIVYSQAEKAYSFTLGEASLEILFNICANYTSYHIDKPLRTSAFLLEALQ